MVSQFDVLDWIKSKRRYVTLKEIEKGLGIEDRTNGGLCNKISKLEKFGLIKTKLSKHNNGKPFYWVKAI